MGVMFINVGVLCIGNPAHIELTKAAAALGINRTMICHGINVPETFEPLGIATRLIADCIAKRTNRMKKRAATRSHFTAPKRVW